MSSTAIPELMDVIVQVFSASASAITLRSAAVSIASSYIAIGQPQKALLDFSDFYAPSWPASLAGFISFALVALRVAEQRCPIRDLLWTVTCF